MAEDQFWKQPRGVPYRTGIVDQIGTGAQQGYVRVTFPDRDNKLSNWLPVVTKATQGRKNWYMPQQGAQVACLMDEHDENGGVMGEVWSTADAPNSAATPSQDRTDYDDGTTILYDESTHQFSIGLVAGATGTIAVAGGASFVISAGTISLTGSVVVIGSIKVSP